MILNPFLTIDKTISSIKYMSPVLRDKPCLSRVLYQIAQLKKADKVNKVKTVFGMVGPVKMTVISNKTTSFELATNFTIIGSSYLNSRAYLDETFLK